MFICLNYESNYLRLSSWKKKQPEFFFARGPSVLYFITFYFFLWRTKHNFKGKLHGETSYGRSLWLSFIQIKEQSVNAWVRNFFYFLTEEYTACSNMPNL